MGRVLLMRTPATRQHGRKIEELSRKLQQTHMNLLSRNTPPRKVLQDKHASHSGSEAMLGHLKVITHISNRTRKDVLARAKTALYSSGSGRMGEAAVQRAIGSMKKVASAVATGLRLEQLALPPMAPQIKPVMAEPLLRCTVPHP